MTITVTPAPIRTFEENCQAPCIRLQLEDQTQVVFPYYLMGETTLEASGNLIVCHFGSSVVQIEGKHLQDLLIGLQFHRIESLQRGKFPEEERNPLTITRLTLVQGRDLE
jgi:hypothetical protein